MATQGELDLDGFNNPAEKYTKEQFQKMEQERYATEKRQNDERDKAIDKAKARKAENEEFKDKRVKASPLTVSSELAKMKEILSGGKGGGGGGGGGGGMPSDKMDKMKKMNYKSGGKVSSASKRADGCAIRGKTRA
jgi:hypothetical protein